MAGRRTSVLSIDAPLDERRRFIQDQLGDLVARAAELGLVVTVTQKPLTPLAMRHYETVVEVREKR